MQEQPYTSGNLSRCIELSDKCKNAILNDLAARKDIGNKSAKKIKEGLAFNSGLKKFNLGKKQGYKFSDISDDLIARLLARNIKSAYPATQSHRQFIVSNAISIMKECLSYKIFRYDIKSFYESIDRKLLLEKLIEDGTCTWQTILLIQKLFIVLDAYDVEGLPRGFAISGALAELRMLSFDQSLRHNEEVFFFSRFVDDILIITSEKTSQEAFDSLVTNALPEELSLHEGEKRSFHEIPTIHSSKKKNAQKQEYYTLNHLGYRIKISNNTTKDIVLGTQRREIIIDLSENKIKKLQDRIIKSFTNYIASKKSSSEFQLLKNRIRVITGNYEVRDPDTKITIKTGIYYSYIHKNSFDDCSLIKLDKFLIRLMFSNDSKLSFRIKKSLSDKQRKELIGYSFSLGFKNKRFHSFSYKGFETIKKVWQ